MAEEKKTIEVKGLGTVTVEREPVAASGDKPAKAGLFTMTDKDVMAFKEANGVPNPKEVAAAEAKAEQALVGKITEFMTPYMVKGNGADYEFRAGTTSGNNTKYEVYYDAQKTVTNPSTGEKSDKYGVVSVKISRKIVFDDEKINKTAAEIEKHMRKQAGV